MKTRYLALIAGAALLTTLSSARADLDEAVKAAVEGPAQSQVNVFEHSFAVQPLEIVSKEKKKHTLKGELTHKDVIGGDHRINYRILKEGGTIREISWQIDGGKWVHLSTLILSILAPYVKGGPIPSDDIEKVDRALPKAANGTWQTTVEILLATIAIRHC